MAGVTPEGFEPKVIDDIREDLNVGLRGVFGQSANLDARSRLGQIRDLVAVPLSDVWEAAEALAGALDPNGANGFLLDNIAALTGTFRRQAIASSGFVIFFGSSSATVVPMGTLVSIPGTNGRFETTSAIASMVATPAFVTATPYAYGDAVASDGATWVALVSGVSGATPSGPGPTFVSGTVTFRRLGTGTFSRSADIVATETGPIPGDAYTITSINTPLAGVTGVVNPLDVTLGKKRETDSELRIRRTAELGGQSKGTVNAVRSAVLAVPNVTTAQVFENVTSAVANGLQPHSIEVLVEGGNDGAIRQAIFDTKPAGIKTNGNVTGSVNDSGSTPHETNFSRPTLVDVYVTVALSKDVATYPADGDERVKEAIAAWGDSFQLGRDVVASAIAAQVFQIPGVLDVSSVKIGTAPNPATSNTLVMSPRQRPVFDSSRITVNSIAGSF